MPMLPFAASPFTEFREEPLFIAAARDKKSQLNTSVAEDPAPNASVSRVLPTVPGCGTPGL
jgi:hypothetical protein